MYQQAAVDRILFIRNAKALGFSLAEIKELLFLRVDDGASCLEIKEIAGDYPDTNRKKNWPGKENET